MSLNRNATIPSYGSTDTRYGGIRNTRPQAGSNFDMNLYHQVCDDISCHVFSINNNVTALEKASKEIGTHTDTPLLRDKIHNTRQGTKDLVTSTTKLLKQLMNVVAKGTREHKLQAERVKNEFAATVQRYDTLQKQLDPKMKQAVLQNQNVTKNIWEDDDDEEEDQQALIQAEKQQQIQEELEFEQGLLLEREEKIRQLEADMLDVNVVFRDLAAMVHEQGTTIGTIEENITTAAYNVEEGGEQLLKAKNYQQAYRKKLCCFVVILVVIAVILAIIISVSLNSK